MCCTGVDLAEAGSPLHLTEPKLATVLLKNLAGKGEFQKALEILAVLQKEGVPNVIHVNTVIAGGGEDWRCCLGLLAALQPKALHPTLISFNSVLKVMAAAHHWRTAGILQEMRFIRIARDIITYNTILSLLKGAGHWRKAQALLEDMPKATVAQDAFSISACLPLENWRAGVCVFDQYDGHMDTAGFNSIIGLSHSSCWRRFLEVLQNMPAMRVHINRRSWNAFNFQGTQWRLGIAAIQAGAADVISFNSAASACEKQRAWRPALELLGSLRTWNLQPQIISFNSAMLASPGPWHGLVAMLDEMWTLRVRPDSASYLAALSNRNSDDSLPEVFLKHMSMAKVERDAATVGAFISSCQSRGRWQLALSWLLDLTPRADHVSCGAAISAFEKAQRWKEALEICYRLLRERRIRLDVLSTSAAINSCESCSTWRLPLALLLQTAVLNLRLSQVSYTAAMGTCIMHSWEVTVNLMRHMIVFRLEPDAASSNVVARAWADRKHLPFLRVLNTLSQQTFNIFLRDSQKSLKPSQTISSYTLGPLGFRPSSVSQAVKFHSKTVNGEVVSSSQLPTPQLGPQSSRYVYHSVVLYVICIHV